MQQNATNTQILYEILRRVTGVEDRLTMVEKKLTTVEGTLATMDRRLTRVEGVVHNLQQYINNDSETNEHIVTNQVMEILERQFAFPGYNITKSNLRVIYLPTSNNPLTDLDGCIIVKQNKSIRVKNMSGNPYNLLDEKAFIIESKHGFTKALIDKKLSQFCKILGTIRDIRSGKLKQSSSHSSKFNNMLNEYKLTTFPDDVVFIFASDFIEKKLIEFLMHISDGKMTEELYNSFILSNFRQHKIISDILDDININKRIKYILKSDQSDIDTIRSIFTDQAPILQQYKSTVHSLLVPYEAVSGCYNMLSNRIAIYSNNTLSLYSAQNALNA